MMESNQKNLLGRSFVMGILGALVTVVVLGGVAVRLWYVPSVRSWARDRISSALLTDQTPAQVDSTGAVDSVVSVVAAANPAVVSIIVSKEVPNLVRQPTPSNNGFFGFMFPSYTQDGTKEQEVAGGTGFFISEDGYIVTNNHVIDIEESSYKVYLNDGSSYDATLVAADDILDVALLKVDAPDVSFVPLSFGDSDAVQAGQTVIAIGNALGEYRNTVSVGVISGLSRTVLAQTDSGNAERLQDILQTDAAINPGNSGGPLLDLAGNVIGVNVAASVGSAENIGFALPANSVRAAVESLKENGRVIRVWLGVRYESITPDLAEREGLSVKSGALILRGPQGELAVVPGSPADKAGIEENDIVTGVDDQDIDDVHDLASLLRAHAPGDKITLHVLHDGEAVDREVTLEERPNN